MITYDDIVTTPRRRQDNDRLFTRLAKRAGMSLSDRPICRRGGREELAPVQWNGKECSWRGNTLSNNLHELAHWLVAAEYRRRWVNFGLGHGPEDNEWAWDAQDRRVSDQLADREECRASVLGIVMEWNLGLNPSDTAQDHNWDIPDGPSFNHQLKWLVKKGLIDEDGNLTF